MRLCPVGRPVHSVSLVSFGLALRVVGLIHVPSWGTLGSFGRGLGVVVFILVRWVLSGAHWCRRVHVCIVVLIWAHPGGRWGHSVSFMCTMGVIQVCWVHSVPLCGSSGSFRFVRFIRALPWCGPLHSGSLGSFWRALGVDGFILARPGVCRFIPVRWVHLDAPLVEIIRIHLIRAGAPWVHSVSLGSFWRALGFVGFIPVHLGIGRDH